MVSNKMAQAMEKGSFIRKMFEEGNRLRALHGADKVFDFSIGNPDLEPPAEVLTALREQAAATGSGLHGYMSNNGYLETRTAVAEWLNQPGLPEPVTPDLICMTVGAAGALNVALKAILDPGDEVIVPAPFFVEYTAYIDNQGGKCVVVPCLPDTFQPDLQAIAAAITPRTKAIILNTPNNPTGTIYSAETLQALDALLQAQPQPIMAISDEPYSAIAFDGQTVPSTLANIQNMIMCYSWSKSLSLPGERIGFCAVSPRCPNAKQLAAACTYANRVLGFVNAPALMQRIITHVLNARVDVARYESRRNALYDILTSCGFNATCPAGGFYIFLKSPISDDLAFADACARHNVLLVPGQGFGYGGYVRLCFAVPDSTIAGSRSAFEKIAQEFGVQQS
jgi:aspartate aminotransferase